MNFLNKEQLEKLTTQRLVTLKRKVTPVTHMYAHYTGYDIGYQEISNQYTDYETVIKSILATREHIERI